MGSYNLILLHTRTHTHTHTQSVCACVSLGTRVCARACVITQMMKHYNPMVWGGHGPLPPPLPPLWIRPCICVSV